MSRLFFWGKRRAGWLAQNRYQTNYAIAGGDGVHPGWAGHLVMAYAFLRGLGVPGDIGTFTVDLKAKQDFETVQIKQKFHGADGKADLEATVERTEKERLPLAEAVKAALVPVTHTIGIEPQ